MSKKSKVIVVDDDPVCLTITKHQLQSANMQVDLALGGIEAWQMLQDQPMHYDAALIDRMMPDMDGMTLFKKIQQSPVHSYLPVVMFTSNASPKVYEKALSAGIFDFIYKPVDANTIVSIIEDAVRHKINMLEKM